jgi:hypothetical protein
MAMDADNAERAMIAWANSLPVAELATELMEAFARDMHGLTSDELTVGLVCRGNGRYLPKGDAIEELRRAVKEAVQLLEHAALIRLEDGGYVERAEFRWLVTRLGLATRAGGKDAVRQRIKDRTGL